MNEYELMLIVVGIATAVAWAFFRHLARMVVWSNQPKLNALRYGFITFCLALGIGETFELWEAAILAAVSMLAYKLIQRERARFELAMMELAARAREPKLARSVYSSRHLKVK
jgi:hypothetical protein